MEVILLEKIGRLGGLGDKVNVKSGYGRNYLIPKGKAVFATEANVAEFEARRAELEAAAAEKLSGAEARAAEIAGLASVTIVATAGDEGKLFGSVGTREIADAAAEKGVELNKSEISMPEGVIRHLGEYSVEIQLHPDVTATLAVVVETE